MATTLHKSKHKGTLRLEDGSDYVLEEGTELAEGHPLVKQRPELFEQQAKPKARRRRSS